MASQKCTQVSLTGPEEDAGGSFGPALRRTHRMICDDGEPKTELFAAHLRRVVARTDALGDLSAHDRLRVSIGLAALLQRAYCAVVEHVPTVDRAENRDPRLRRIACDP